MGSKKATKHKECFLLQPFYFLSITILSLLLPLSFLLLARISSSNYFVYKQTGPSDSSVASFFFYTNPFLLQILVWIISLSSLIRVVTGRVTLLPDSPARPTLHAAWVFLCTLQVCVGLGIEATMDAGFDGSGFKGRNWATRLVFFVGVHEAMMHWCRSVVKPVVDDTLMGGPRPEGWPERAVLAAGCGGLWWLRLRERVETLVAVVELKMESMGAMVGIGDFLGWSLYYLVVIIGIARIFKGLFWIVFFAFSERREEVVEGESLLDVQEQV